MSGTCNLAIKTALKSTSYFFTIKKAKAKIANDEK